MSQAQRCRGDFDAVGGHLDHRFSFAASAQSTAAGRGDRLVCAPAGQQRRQRLRDWLQSPGRVIMICGGGTAMPIGQAGPVIGIDDPRSACRSAPMDGQHRLPVRFRSQAVDGDGVGPNPQLDLLAGADRAGTEYKLTSKETRQSLPTRRRCLPATR